MRKKYMLIGVVGIVMGVLLSSAVFVLAGTPDSLSVPGATNSYALDDIYNRLGTGADGAQSAFTEPGVVPGTGTMHTLNDIMGQAPAVDDTDGAGVADVASGKTFWGLTSGVWGTRTGTGTIATYAAAVPKTGQTTSYGTRDDGELKMGVAWPATRFITSTTGIVTDTLTGLIWLKDANCFGTKRWKDAGTYPALGAANTLNSGECGLSDGSVEGDWRLPNVRELHSLIDFSQYNPALPSGHPFDSVQSHYYWSSTTAASGASSYVWPVSLEGGFVYRAFNTNTYYVWPVRGGQ